MKKYLTCITILVLLALAAPAAADYPAFHYDAQRTGYSPEGGPVTDTIAWEVELPESPDGSPVVIDGKVLVATWPDMDFGDGDPMALYCFDAETGDAVWNYPFPEAGYGSISGIATGEGQAFLGGTDGYLYAINLDDGSLAWNALIDPAPGYFGISSSPLVYGGMVYALSHSDGILHVFNPEGEPQGTFETGGEVQFFTSPAASGDTLFFAGNRSRLFAVQINSRQELWNFSADGTVRSSPVIGPDSVYFSTTTTLYSLSKSDGIENWNTSIDASLSTPALADGFLYLGTKDGLSCFDIEDGSEEWSFSTAAVDVSPVVAGNLVYFATNEQTGTVYAVDRTAGTEAWHYSQSAPPDSNYAAYYGSSPAISGGMLFIGGEYWNRITAFGTLSPAQDVIFDDTVTLSPGTFDLVPANNASATYAINQTSALGALHAAADAGGFEYLVNESTWGLFVDAIDGYASDDVEYLYWLYKVTTVSGDVIEPVVGAAEYECADGDIVTFYYGPWGGEAIALLNITVEITDEIPAQDVIFDGTVTLAPETFDLVPANNASATYAINQTSALGALHAAADAGGFDYLVNESTWGLFVDAIDGYASDDVEYLYWLYQVTTASGDVIEPVVGAAEYECADGDTVTFYYGGWTVEEATAIVNVTVDITDDIPTTGLSVNDGSRGGTVTATVDLVADSNGWYAVVVSGVNGNGDSLAGIATARLSAGEELELPVLIAVPHQAQTGTYLLYAGVYALDIYPKGIISHFGGVECDIS